jgi:hypothetical protein
MRELAGGPRWCRSRGLSHPVLLTSEKTAAVFSLVSQLVRRIQNSSFASFYRCLHKPDISVPR